MLGKIKKMAMSKKLSVDETVDTSFSELILGFSSAALYYIGHGEIEGKKSSEVNLPLSLYNIKIIELLQKKTKGNLTEDEEMLVRQVLKDLKEKYQSVLDG